MTTPPMSPPASPAPVSNEPASPGSHGEPPLLGHHKGFEVYPMPLFALLECDDVARARAFWVEALGFAEMFGLPAPDGSVAMSHLRRRKYQDVMLVPRTSPLAEGPRGCRLLFDANGELDALAARARQAAPTGRSRVEEPVITPWNTRELRVTDPDGHVVAFHERHDDPEAHAHWKATFERDRQG